MRAFAELSERGDRIAIHFPYDPNAVASIKEVPGARFVPRDKGGPFWTVPLDLTAGRRLREAFGDGLALGDALKSWGRRERERERNMGELSNASDAKLDRLPKVHPELAEYLRPYQRADVVLMAEESVLNANQPGTGKTVEVIAAVLEAGLEEGFHLVAAPVTSHDDVWVTELRRWRPDATVLWGETPKARNDAIAEAALLFREDPRREVWLIQGFEPLRLREDKDAPPILKNGKQVKPRVARFPDLFAIEFNSSTIDESHKTGLAGYGTLFNEGANRLVSVLRYSLSGTPMGGKTRRLFGHLNWTNPKEYASFWRWANSWLVVSDNGYGHNFGSLQPGREDEFYGSHAKHLVRRLKRTALPGLPEQVHVEVHCPMTKKQAKVYRDFARDAEVRLGEDRVSGSNVLAEYTRLKQFANALCEVREDGDVWPTAESGKWPMVLEKLDEQGLRRKDPEPGARAIVSTQSKRAAEVFADYLRENGIGSLLLTGDLNGARRNEVIRAFKTETDEPIVLVMTTQTGGVALNLEAANSVHILDETWSPDDQEQLADRADRGSRTTALVVYTYRTKETIQEYIAEVGDEKTLTNQGILDARRRGLRATN